MTTVLLLQTSPWRDAAHDAVLTAAARELDPIRIVAATSDPERTERMTGLPVVAADRRTVLRTLRSVDAVVVVGGRPLASAATNDQVLGLAELYALAVATRTAGKRFAMIGVAAGRLESRRDAFLARRLMIGSAMAVVDEPDSAQILQSAGVPSPIRVGSDLAWLELQEPPPGPAEEPDRRDADPGEEIWFTMTSPGVEAAGGPAVVARKIAAVQSSLAARLHVPDPGVLVQGWRGGAASGADLEVAAEVSGELRRQDVRARVLPPPLSLTEVRDAMTRVALCVTGHPHALMAAAAAGVGVIAWPDDRPHQTMSEWLGVPALPKSSGSVAGAVDRALAAAGETLPVVREQIATAGEVVDLLRVLLTDGGELPRTPSAGRVDNAHLVRPTGVMR